MYMGKFGLTFSRATFPHTQKLAIQWHAKTGVFLLGGVDVHFTKSKYTNKLQ